MKYFIPILATLILSVVFFRVGYIVGYTDMAAIATDDSIAVETMIIETFQTMYGEN